MAVQKASNPRALLFWSSHFSWFHGSHDFRAFSALAFPNLSSKNKTLKSPPNPDAIIRWIAGISPLGREISQRCKKCSLFILTVLHRITSLQPLWVTCCSTKCRVPRKSKRWKRIFVGYAANCGMKVNRTMTFRCKWLFWALPTCIRSVEYESRMPIW